MGESSQHLVGRVVDGKYRLEQYLGGGAMGDVFRACHVKVGRGFAIKILHDGLIASPKLRARFAREAEIGAKLRHPNVVPVLDIGETDGMAFLVMELAAGTSLGVLLDGTPFEAARAIRLVRQLCDGLAHAHELGLVHRDLKPDNVIVEPAAGGEIARIIDFGVALVGDDPGVEARARERLTTGGIVLGSPQYVAPEVATGRPYDHRADLFALGIMCFEMLCGRMPFDGRGVDAVHANVMQETPAMAARAPGVAVDPLLEAFTRKLMEKDPDARPASAADARRLLDQIEQDPQAAAAALGVELPRVVAVAPVAVTPLASQPIALEPPARRTRSRRLAVAAALACGVGAAAMIAIATLRAPERVAAPAALARIPVATAPISNIAPAAVAPAPRAKVTSVVPPAPAVPARPAITTRATPVALPPVAAKQPRPSPAPVLGSCGETPAVHVAPPPNELVARYVAVGRALGKLGQADGVDELWQRYRLIRIQQALVDDSARAHTVALLDDIEHSLDRRTR